MVQPIINSIESCTRPGLKRCLRFVESGERASEEQESSREKSVAVFHLQGVRQYLLVSEEPG